MILYCSNLPNDQDMIAALGDAVVPAPLPYGDVVFFGAGAADSPLKVCVERKHIPDMASCIITGRYLHQLRSAKDAGFDVLVLIVEGRYRRSPADGLLEIPGYDRAERRNGWKPLAPTITFSRFDQYLTELEFLAGVIVKRTENVRDTADVTRALWDQFQTPPDGHKSLKVMFHRPAPRAFLRKPSLLRRVAAELPRVGWERSGAIANRFSSVVAMCQAGVDDWASIPGVGKKTARSIVLAINGVRLEGKK